MSKCACGGEARPVLCYGRWQIQCTQCNEPGPGADTVAEAVKRWNNERGASFAAFVCMPLLVLYAAIFASVLWWQSRQTVRELERR